jgi:hypothetical protein
MTDGDKDGQYCTICGGIPEGRIKIKKIVVDGMETGIDRLDEVLAGVAQLKIRDEAALKEALVKAVSQYNYVPGKKRDAYADGLLAEYRKRIVE